MGYLKYTQYVYILFAVYFVYDGVTKLNAGNDTSTLSFLIAGMAVFMFSSEGSLSRNLMIVTKNNKKWRLVL